MAVKKRVVSSIESFIDKGADVKSSKEKSYKNVLLRIPDCVLKDLDYIIEKKPWVSRTKWIIEAIHDKIKSELDESQENIRTGN